MPISSSTTTITARDGGRFDAYLALPERTPAPAIVLIAAVFGVNDDFKALADRYARNGFIALAPDPFWRVQPGTLPRSQTDAARARAKQVDQEQLLDDIATCAQTLRERPECNGKIGIAGFCFGGKYAFLAAARGLVDAAASFHGTDVGSVLDEAAAIRVPLSLHWGDADHVAPMSEIDAVKAALAGKPDVEVAVYPGVGHGFTAPDGAGYNAEVTAKSEASVFAMFEGLTYQTA